MISALRTAERKLRFTTIAPSVRMPAHERIPSSVWRMGAEPWINPDGADVDAIIEAIRRYPSGALSYSIESVDHRDVERDPAIYVCKDGPYQVTGGIDLKDVS